MSTIAELVLKLRGDNTNLRQTLADSAQRAVAFTMTIQDAMAMAGKNVARQEGMGALAAKGFLESMQATLASEQLRIKEQQYNMFITPAEAERLAGEAALAYNESILQTIASLRASGNLTATLERQLIENLDKAGLKAGLALQRAVAVGIEEGQGVARGAATAAARGTFTAYTAEAEKSMARSRFAITQASGAFTQFGHRGATALTAVGFGMEAFANGTEGGVRRSLRSVESFALFFGTGGLLVAALTTGLFAIYDYFHKAEKRADQAVKRITANLEQAINAGDTIALQKSLRDVQQGQAATIDEHDPTKLVMHKRSQFAADAFEGSGADLEARIADVNRRIAIATKEGRVSLVGTLTKDVEALEAEIKPIRERYNMIKDLIMNPLQQMKVPEARKPIEIKGESPESRSAEATKDYYESLGILMSRMEAARTSGQAYQQVLQQILDEYSKLGGMSAAISGAPLPGEKLEDTQKRLAMIKELHKALLDIGPKVSITIEDPGGTLDKLINAQLMKAAETPMPRGAFGEQMKAFDDLISSVEIYRNNIELTNMDLQAQGKSVIDIEKAMEPLRAQAVAMATTMRTAMRAAGLDPALVDLIVQHWLEGLKRIGAAGDETAGRLQRIADVMQQVSQAANSVANINDALGGNRNTSNVISSAGSAASSIGTAVASGGTDIAADLQALADVINVGNALTASSREIALEHKEILKQNNDRLAEVSMRLVGFAVSAGTSSQAQKALEALFGNHAALSQLASGATHTSGFLGTGSSGDLQTQIDALMPFLRSVGLTFEQFKKIAEDNGFDILDKNGRLVTDALEQMRDKLQDVIRSLFTFQNTLSDQKALSDLQFKLSGQQETPQTSLDQNLALIQKLAPNLLPSGASGQGALNQDALRKMLQDLLQRIASGQVNPADFGGFQNLQELVGVIDSTATALNELRDVTNGVTASLTNVPTGFKLALLEFDSQLAQARHLVSSTPPTPTPIPAPYLPDSPAYPQIPRSRLPQFNSAAMLQDTMESQLSPPDLDSYQPSGGGDIYLTIEAGAVTIDPTNKNAAEIGQESLESLKALAGQKLGNRARWTDLV